MSVCREYIPTSTFVGDPKHIVEVVKFEELQLDFWISERETEHEMMKRRLLKVEASGHAVRRGTYAMINEQRKRIEELEARLSHIERGLCYGK